MYASEKPWKFLLFLQSHGHSHRMIELFTRCDFPPALGVGFLHDACQKVGNPVLLESSLVLSYFQTPDCLEENSRRMR
jgi:hypothetical protein